LLAEERDGFRLKRHSRSFHSRSSTGKTFAHRDLATGASRRTTPPT
jgi:hypothetical protein